MKLNKIKKYLILSAIFLPNIVFACYSKPNPFYIKWIFFSNIFIILFLPIFLILISLYIKKIRKKIVLIISIILLILFISTLVIRSIDYIQDRKNDKIAAEEQRANEEWSKKCKEDIRKNNPTATEDELMFSEVASCLNIGLCGGSGNPDNLSGKIIDKLFNTGN